MSGILIPGQENKPQPSGGIEIAKGFSRKEETDNTTAVSQQTPATDSAEGTPEASEPRTSQPHGEGPNFLYPPMQAPMQCPNCNTQFAVLLFSIVDLGANPELKVPLLNGQINAASCPKCGAGGPLNAPLMVHVPEQEFLGVFVPPSEQAGGLQQQQIIGDFSKTVGFRGRDTRNAPATV